MRYTFFGCCASVGKLSAKSMALSVRSVIVFFMVPSLSPSTRHSTLDTRPFSFDHPIRSRQNIRRNRQPDLLGRFEIDDELELLRLLYREISRLGAFQNLVHIGGGAPEEVGIAWGVGQKPPVLHILWLPIHCRQSVLYSKICNLYSVRIEDGARQHEN